jgi:hypothetical protein
MSSRSIVSVEMYFLDFQSTLDGLDPAHEKQSSMSVLPIESDVACGLPRNKNRDKCLRRANDGRVRRIFRYPASLARREIEAAHLSATG